MRSRLDSVPAQAELGRATPGSRNARDGLGHPPGCGKTQQGDSSAAKSRLGKDNNRELSGMTEVIPSQNTQEFQFFRSLLQPWATVFFRGASSTAKPRDSGGIHLWDRRADT